MPRSRPSARSPIATDVPVEGTPPPLLDGDLLRGVSSLWRRSRRELLARFGGDSMRPTIAPGQEVAVACGDAFAEGDIVAFQSGDRLVVHRVLLLRAGDGCMLTCGDALHLPDPLVTDLSGVLGAVRGVRRGGVLEAPGPAPPSAVRSLARVLCRLALLLGPGACRRLTLLYLRLRLWGSRLRSSARSTSR